MAAKFKGRAKNNIIQLRVSAACYMKNGYDVWAGTPKAGVTSAETSWLHIKCSLEDWILIPVSSLFFTPSKFFRVLAGAFAERRPSLHESRSFGPGSPLQSQPPRPSNHSNTNQIVRGIISFQKSCDLLLPFQVAIPISPMYTALHIRIVVRLTVPVVLHASCTTMADLKML